MFFKILMHTIGKIIKAIAKAFFVAIKAVAFFILNNLDDLFIIAGIGFLSVAGFILHVIAGYTVLGAGCIAFGVLIAKGGGIVASKKRTEPKV